MVRVRAVPQFAVVMFAVPSKLLPLIVLAVNNLLAETALSLMPRAPRVVRAVAASASSRKVRANAVSVVTAAAEELVK
jgi:hypothetical protein